MSERFDFYEEIPRAAWLHWCGQLNPGSFADAVERSLGTRACCACSFEVKHPEVEVVDFTMQVATVQP